MIKHYTLTIMSLLVAILGSSLFAQTNMSLVGQLDYGATECSDIWGYEDSMNNEYALVGLETGFSIVDVSTNPANPTELFFVSGAFSSWRDIKTWGTFAYVTNEEAGGLLIVDMTNLPDSIVYQELTYGGQLNSAHNIFIDENGFAYLVGTDNPAGTMIMDLNTDPYNPTWVGSYSANYVHDAFVRNDTMWTAEINAGVFSVVDVSSKVNPVVLASKATPSNFTHNVWLSDDGQTLFTTDEQPNSFIASYDVSNLNNITELDRYQSSPGQNVIPHNTFVLGNFLLTSYYRDGVVINDVTNPDNIIEVGNYDTSPFSGQGFNGCWGVYPYLSSGNIIATDIEGGLFVIAPAYVQACYLEGVVTDSATGAFLQGVDISLVNTSVQTVTGLIGEYKSGIANAGTFDVVFSKPGYNSKVIIGVSLTNGNLTTVDAVLSMKPSFSFSIVVVDANSLDPVPDAIASIKSNQFSYNETGDASGTIGIGSFFDGNYEIIVGKWGYKTQLLTNQNIDVSNNLITVALTKGYYDDFALDFSWTTSGIAAAGLWERGEPIGTSNQGNQSNPDLDVTDDLSDLCFVTGNAGGGAGNDDVDDGFVLLTSPVFDMSGYGNPYVNYHTWFYNGGGFGGNIPNDSLVISISNGIDEVDVEVITMNNALMSQWVYNEFRIFDYVAPTANMQLKVRAADSDPGHLVEGGFDKFQIVDSADVTAVEDMAIQGDLKFDIFPNPASNRLNIELVSGSKNNMNLKVFDLIGNQLDEIEIVTGLKSVHKTAYDVRKLSEGLYFLQLTVDDQKVVKKFVVTH